MLWYLKKNTFLGLQGDIVGETIREIWFFYYDRRYKYYFLKEGTKGYVRKSMVTNRWELVI